MRKWFNTLMLVAIGTSAPYLSAYHSDATADIIIGYRQDNSRWSFKAPVDDRCKFKITNSLDEVHIFELGLAANTIVDCCFYVRGYAKWGWVLDGDYHERTQRFRDGSTRRTESGEMKECAPTVTISKVNSLLDGRYTVDLGLGIGYPFYFCDCTVKFIPVVGYAYQEQNYRVDKNDKVVFIPAKKIKEDGEENSILSKQVQNAAKGNGLEVIDNVFSDTKFVSRWWGPWIGIDMEYDPCLCWELYGRLEWHFAQFKGKVQAQTGIDEYDNLSLSTHNANGFVLRVGANYEYCDCWILGLYAFYEDWDANKKATVRCDASQENKKHRRRMSIAEADDGKKHDHNDDFLEPGDKFRLKNKHHGYGVGVTLGTTF